MNNPSAIIFTPPRTGRNFLHIGLGHLTHVWLESNNSNYQKDLSNFEKIISIARDPKDSVVSLSTMIKEKDGVSVLDDIGAAVKIYNNFMKRINDLDCYVYKFDDLKNNPEKVFFNISQLLNVEVINPYDKTTIDDLMDDFDKNNTHGYKKTFINTDKYNTVNKIVNDADLSDSYKLYNIAIKNTIKI